MRGDDMSLTSESQASEYVKLLLRCRPEDVWLTTPVDSKLSEYSWLVL